MAKLALINRQEKREKLVAKYAKKREALQAVIDNARTSDEDRFAAWFEPDHYVLERTAPFFVRRFAGMNSCTSGRSTQ